ncbi:hypothetical protein [Micromonospora sp. NBC_01638]|nr:hypothetical protein OG811_30755 [Micromonospora sp. NBC_01638]
MRQPAALVCHGSQRAQVLLRAANGMSNADIAVLAGATRVTVRA